MATGLFNLKQVNQAISQGAWSGYIAPKWVEYLVVAGGGGGGGNYGGGGGGGGLLTGIVTVAAGTSYTVTVGSGGTGSSGPGLGATGVSSVFGAISATGGGGGGGNSLAALSGGSGGGGTQSFAIGQGTLGQGNAGGLGYTAVSGGGGGGAGTVGLSSTSSAAGNGGAGIASAISGTVTTYAGGGGGYATSGSIGSGGVGGGGAGAVSGGGNTGGGGGGWSGSAVGNGGSGIVVVRYPGSVQFFTGGTLSYANGYMIHTFYASGTLAPTTPTPYVTDYQISRSLRFNSADSAYLNRTPGSATNRRTWTWSGWVKKTVVGDGRYPALFGAQNTTRDVLRFNGEALNVFFNNTSSANLITTAVYRDVSAWYHVVLAVDTTQATDTNRIKLYVNGVQVTAFSTASYPAQNYDTFVNMNVAQRIGSDGNLSDGYFNGYMTEVNFIDGQALTPSSFGYTDPDTGVWSPLAFVGTYGTNGFYLNFSDNSNTTAATLGKDYSGNGNNWTPNNFSVTAGAGNDSLVDSPTSYGTDTGVGGTVRGNYCTLNPLDKESSITLANGNLDVTASGTWVSVRSTFGMTSGKWYWETTFNGFQIMIGIGTSAATLSNYIGADTNGWAYYFGGQKYTNSTATAYGASYTAGDIIGIAFDADTGSLTFYKNGTSQGVAFTGLTSGPYFPALGLNNATPNINFGQRPFAYTAPSGFKALCTQNLVTPTIGATSTTLASKFFAPTIYTQAAGANTITTGLDMSTYGGLIWEKPRSIVESNYLTDTVRGLTKYLVSNTTAAEGTTSTYIQSVTSTGYTTAANSWATGTSMVSWDWIAGGTATSNTAGSITSTVSANTTSGFSIVTFAAAASSTVGHGLGVTPSMVVVKSRTVAGNYWLTYHVSTGATGYLAWNTTDAFTTNASVWNNTAPTSTVFTIGSGFTNASYGNCVAYCFAEVAGYSKFGSYTGNGSADGVFVYTGFRPAYVMVKCSSSGGNDWIVEDATRSATNVMDARLFPNTSDAEISNGNGNIDFLSNGFKLRNSHAGMNASGSTYIYACFASVPTKFSLAR